MERKDVPPPYDGVNPGYGQTFSPSSAPPHPSNFHAPQPSQPVSVQPQFTSSSNTTVTVNTGPSGGCPVCNNRGWTGTYSCCAWLWCLCCFPCGLICCLCMRKKKCSKCGFTVG